MRKTANHILSESTRIIAAKIIDKSDEVQVNAGLMHAALMEAADRITELDTVIRETIEANLDLADGDNCTLIKLKNAIDYRGSENA